jgi:hypothetical protein
LYEGISAEHSSIDDIVRKARHYEKALANIRPGRGPDRDYSHDSHESDARRAESHEGSISLEPADMSYGSVGPVRRREALTNQDNGSESSQYNEDSEAEDSHITEHDEDSEEGDSYPKEFDGNAAPSDEGDQDGDDKQHDIDDDDEDSRRKSKQGV